MGEEAQTRERDFRCWLGPPAAGYPAECLPSPSSSAGHLCQDPAQFLSHLYPRRVVASFRETWSPQSYDLGLYYLQEGDYGLDPRPQPVSLQFRFYFLRSPSCLVEAGGRSVSIFPSQ